MEKKNGAKKPQTPHPKGNWHMPSPLQKSGNLDTSNPNLTQPCGRGGGPGVVALATREQSANNSPHRPAPTCRAGPQSPVPGHSPPHSGERASECNEAPGTTSGARFVESPQCNGGHEPEWSTPEFWEKGANEARSLDKWRSNSGRNHL